MGKLDSQILEQIKKCGKDEASQSKLIELFTGLVQKIDTAFDQLSLLENAVKHDYDSILITELSLEAPGPKIVYVNDGFTKMTGYTKEEAIGNTPRMLQGEKTDQHVLDRLKQRLIDGQAFFGHTINYRKDGSEFVNQWDIHPLTNKAGEITHWVSYQRDITDRQESSKMLFDANIDFEKLEEESKRTFIDLDIQGNIVASNKSFRETLALDADELKEVKIWDLVSEKDKDQVKELFNDFNATGVKNSVYNWEFQKSSGEIILFEAGVRWFVSNDETIIRIHFDNISLREKVINALNKKAQTLNLLLESPEEFTLKFKRADNGKIYCSYASNSFGSITGFSKSEILDGGIEIVLQESSLSIFKEGIEKAFEGHLCSQKCEYLCKESNGVNVIQSFRPVWDDKEENVVAVKAVGLLELSA